MATAFSKDSSSAVDSSPPAAAIVLASASPRRLQLLQQIGVPAQVKPVDVDETALPEESPEAYVLRLAQAKAAAGWQLCRQQGEPPLPVLGSDTAVVVDQQILGKPRDAADAKRMLKLLSGRQHQVISAVAIQLAEQVRAERVITEVSFHQLDEALVERYWHTGEPCDKAGAYGIQGLGAVFVSKINGSYSNVVGLPLAETSELLQAFAVSIWQH